MDSGFVLLDVAKQLKRIADALEESNKMIKDLKWVLEKKSVF